MDAADLHFKEYERDITIIDRHQRDLNRIIFLRTIILAMTTLIFMSYLRQLSIISELKKSIEPLLQMEKNYTVLGYLASHQRIENMVYVPDEKAKALLSLIPKLASFLDEDLTLENQASQQVTFVLDKATKKPERIKIDNPYLPKFSVPITYTTMAIIVYLSFLTSFFYVSYRLFIIGFISHYAFFNLNCLNKLIGLGNGSLLLSSQKLPLHGAYSDQDFDSKIKLKRTQKEKWSDFLLRIFGNWIANMGYSPFKFINNLITAALFIFLSILVSKIILNEIGEIITPWYEIVLTIIIITLPYSFLLKKINSYFKTRFISHKFFTPPLSSEY